MRIPPGAKRRRKMREIAARNGCYCHYCGKTLAPIRPKRPVGTADDSPTLDHVIPRSQGGTSDLDNLVLACRKCNRSKSSMTADEFTATRGG